MELFLARVYPEMITVIWRWSSNAFLWYIQIKASNPSKGISDLIAGMKAFYPIQEAELVFYTPCQSITQSYMLHTQRGATKVTTSFLLLPR